MLARSGCARTLPREWSPKLTDWNSPDGFNCSAQRSLRVEREIRICNAFPAEILDQATAIPQAWCFEGERTGKALHLRCYEQKADCVGEHPDREDGCILQGPEKAIAEAFGVGE